MPIRRRHPILVFLLLIVLAVAVVLIMPWAFHIGGRWTPLVTWNGTGTLHSSGGKEYPIWISFHPSKNSSQLRLDGLRPSSGLGGLACLCMSPDTTQVLTLSGTLYGAWASTEGSMVDLRLRELKVIDVGQTTGFFDLNGRWQGQDLVMNDRGRPGSEFRSGLRIAHASVTLRPSSFWTCKSACANLRK